MNLGAKAKAEGAAASGGSSNCRGPKALQQTAAVLCGTDLTEARRRCSKVSCETSLLGEACKSTNVGAAQASQLLASWREDHIHTATTELLEQLELVP